MTPTIKPGQMITVIRLTDSGDAARGIRRGEIVVYSLPSDTVKQYVKRIVGLPGDTLQMADGALRVDSRPMKEPYAWHEDRLDPVIPEMEWMRKHEVGRPVLPRTGELVRL